MSTALTPLSKLVEPGQAVGQRLSLRSRALHSRTFMTGAVMTGSIVLLVLLAPAISRYSPVGLDPLHPLSGPSGLHWLGTDELGRDTWSR